MSRDAPDWARGLDIAKVASRDRSYFLNHVAFDWKFARAFTRAANIASVNAAESEQKARQRK
jgi:hypothetical protein